MAFKVTNPIGKKGEDTAVGYLKQHGYKILERNFRKHYGEIDIIAIDASTPLEHYPTRGLRSQNGRLHSSGVILGENEETLVFIEVKTRTSNQFGTPLESITYYKLKPLLKTAQLYATSHPSLPQSLRIDAIGIILDEDLKVVDLQHHKNISGF